MSSLKVAILMGSDSDYEVMKEAGMVLTDFGIKWEMQALSAHRSPELTAQFASNAEKNGFGVVIAGAGGAAHLAGVIAAHTSLPVIGVPINATSLQGMDSLLATVQMPPGIPVATVSVGGWGARNAGILAVQILSLQDADLKKKLKAFKEKMVSGVRSKNEKLQGKIKGGS